MDVLKQKISDVRESIVKLEADLVEKDKELLAIKQNHKMFEAEARAAHRSRDVLELKVEEAQKELKDCLLKLEENQKAADESKRATDSLEKKRNAQEKIIFEFENKLQRVTETAKEAQTKSTKVIHELREIEEKIDQIEIINEKKEKTINELQAINAFYSNKLKLIKSAVSNESAGVDEVENKIVEVTKQLDAANRRAKSAEDQAQLNQLELARLEDELSEWKDKNTTLRSEIDRINVELQ
nr:tropomyosin [Hymenolepis microstoma]